MDPRLEQDVIRLVVPAAPEAGRLVRAAGGSLARRADFDDDGVDDVCLAIGEAWTVVLGGAERSAPVVATLAVLGAAHLEVSLQADAVGAQPRREPEAEAVLHRLATIRSDPAERPARLVFRIGPRP